MDNLEYQNNLQHGDLDSSNFENSINDYALNNNESINNNSFSNNFIKFFENSVISLSFAIQIIIFSLYIFLNRNNYTYKHNLDNNLGFQVFNNSKSNEIYYEKNSETLTTTSIYNSQKILENFFSKKDHIETTLGNINENYENYNKNIDHKQYIFQKPDHNYKRNLITKDYIKNNDLKLKENVFKDLFRHSYYGNWTSNIPIINFDNKSGELRIIMHLATNFRFKDIYLSYIIFLYDGKNKNQWMIIENKVGISLNNTKIEKNNEIEKLEIKHNNIPVLASQYEVFDNIHKNYLSLNLNYYLDKSIYNNITGKIDNMYFGKDELKIKFNVSKERISFFSKISSLSICLCLIGILQTLNSRKLIEIFEKYPEKAKNVFLF